MSINSQLTHSLQSPYLNPPLLPPRAKETTEGALAETTPKKHCWKKQVLCGTALSLGILATGIFSSYLWISKGMEANTGALTRCSELANEFSNLNIQHEVLFKEHEKLQNEMSGLQDEIQGIQKEWERTTQELELIKLKLKKWEAKEKETEEAEIGIVGKVGYLLLGISLIATSILVEECAKVCKKSFGAGY